MLAVPTTRITVLRGTTTNAFGDTVNAANVVAAGVPASLIEQRQSTSRYADRRRGVIRYATCRVDGALDVRKDDRIRDETTNIVWQVDDDAHLSSFISTTDRRLRLRRASGPTT